MTKVTLLSGGVGGARAARGFVAVVPRDDLTVVVNVGDDDTLHGVHVSADLDTVVYTLAGREGPFGWGLAADTYTVMDSMAATGIDTSFRIGDTDFGLCMARTLALGEGEPLSSIVARIADTFGVTTRVLPATDDHLRTRIRTASGEWLAFQDYFVLRRHRDEVIELAFDGAGDARPAPGVLDALQGADVVVIAPSNPPLSVWPILAVPGVREAVAAAPRVIAISPLFQGAALKGPADRVLRSLGLPAGNAGVLAAYDGLITDLVVDGGDEGDVTTLAGDVTIHATDTRIPTREASARLARHLLDLP